MAEDLADAARRFFDSGVRAADPADAVRRGLFARSGEIARASRVYLLAFGKAAVPMLRAALDVLPRDDIASALAVTNDENIAPIAGAEVLPAGHPLPDARGARAAEALEAIAARAGEGELVICLISGGASAMLPAPVEGVSLADKIAASNLLLRSGADIVAMNTVRKALSRLKGGGLARAIAPAQCLALILSDVPGDDLRTIASGPTLLETAAPGAAFAIVRDLGLLEQLPASVKAHLSAPPVSAPADTSHVENVLVGSNRLSLRAMEDAAASAGFSVHVLSEWLDGDVQTAAEAFARAASAAGHGRIAILAGGETSVHVTGQGKGGRNQELALRVARELTPKLTRPWVFLSGGTDGRDGPTDAAGGVVTGATLPRLVDAGVTLEAVLADNDAYHGLAAVDGLLMTGATGTNVADLQVLLLG